MSKVQEFVSCPQCDYDEADRLYDCRSLRDDIMCPRCGYQESWVPQCDETGKIKEWKHDTRKGVGVLSYRMRGAVARRIHFLHSEEEYFDAERWLREQLQTGAIDQTTAYLTRWDAETASVQTLLGDLPTLNAIADCSGGCS